VRPEIFSPKDLPQPAGYSQVVDIPAGRLVWTSGQVSIDAQGEIIGVNDWEQQTRQALTNVGTALVRRWSFVARGGEAEPSSYSTRPD